MGNTAGGQTGRVMMDDLGDRAPLFAAFYISPTRDRAMKVGRRRGLQACNNNYSHSTQMVNMESYRLTNCDGLVNRTGCFDLKLTDMMTGFWPSENGSMPVDEPVCGFRGQVRQWDLNFKIFLKIYFLNLNFEISLKNKS
jgi:guanylate cyclase